MDFKLEKIMKCKASKFTDTYLVPDYVFLYELVLWFVIIL